MGNSWKRSVDRAGTTITHVTEGVGLFTEDDGRVRAGYCLRGEDVAFLVGERQVEGGNSPGNTIKVQFTGSKGDQGGKMAVLLRMKGVGDKGCETVELLQELC